MEAFSEGVVAINITVMVQRDDEGAAWALFGCATPADTSISQLCA